MPGRTSRRNPSVLPFQPTPILTRVIYEGEGPTTGTTDIIRAWRDADARSCRLCPLATHEKWCWGTGMGVSVCRIKVTGRVAADAARLFRFPDADGLRIAGDDLAGYG